MFDFMRNGESKGDKNLEALGAYLDNALTAAERERLEARLARDANLRAELEQLRTMKLQLRAMPRRRAPRSFALDPARYGRPKAQPLMQFYPVLRGATALTAFLLIFVLALGAFQGQFSAGDGAVPAAITSEAAVEEAAAPVAESESFALDEAATQREAEPSERAEEAPTAMVENSPAATTMPTETAAQEALTGELAIEAATLPETTPAIGGGVNPTDTSAADLAREGTAPAAEATFAVVAEEMATTAASTDTLADSAETDAVTPAARGIASSLLPLQVGLGVLFILALILWLIARRRARSL
jgi:hypothetical protein